MFSGVISSDLEPHGLDGPVGSSFPNYQYPVIGTIFLLLHLLGSNRANVVSSVQKTSMQAGRASALLLILNPTMERLLVPFTARYLLTQRINLGLMLRTLIIAPSLVYEGICI